ncbi:hypothetical protein K8R33_00895 [archaeon]|nr:hypothetical protein [archaeon]
MDLGKYILRGLVPIAVGSFLLGGCSGRNPDDYLLSGCSGRNPDDYLTDGRFLEVDNSLISVSSYHREARWNRMMGTYWKSESKSGNHLIVMAPDSSYTIVFGLDNKMELEWVKDGETRLMGGVLKFRPEFNGIDSLPKDVRNELRITVDSYLEGVKEAKSGYVRNRFLKIKNRISLEEL